MSPNDRSFNDPAFEILCSRGMTLRRIRTHGNTGSGRFISGKIARYLPDAEINRSLRAEVEEFDPDIVHIAGGRTAALRAVRAMRGYHRAAMVLDHGAIDGLNLLSPLDWQTYFSRRIDAIVVPSYAMVNNWMGKPYLRRAITAGRCEVMYHPVPVLDPVSANERAELRARHGFREDEFVLGTVCSIRPIKNLEFIARVASRLGGNCVLAVVGPLGDKAYISKVQAAGGDRLRFLGPIPNARRMMAALDLYATPTRVPGESFGLAPAEAMAAGVPVLTMQFGGTAEIVENGVSGLALPPNHADWIEVIGELANNVQRREAMGSAARKRISDRFSPSAIADRCEDLYRRKIAARSP